MNGPPNTGEKSAAALHEGLTAHRQGRLTAARALYTQVLGVHPEDFQALHLLGLIGLQTDDPASALQLFQKALAINPHCAEAHNDMGSALLMTGRCEAAVASYQRAIELKSDYAEAFYNRGNALLDLHRYQRAIESYDAAVAIKADYVAAHINRGLACSCLKRYEAAIADFDQALAILPENAEVHCFRGNALHDLGRHQASIFDYDKAIEFNPRFAEAHNGRGSALAKLKNFPAALRSYGRAIDIKNDFFHAYSNRGNVFKELGEWQAALDDYDKALALAPSFAEAHFNRADVSRRLMHFDAAMAGYDRAIALRPDLPFLPGQRLHASMQVCAWRAIEAGTSAMAAGIERGESVSPPFAVLGLTADPVLQRRAAEIWVREQCPADSSLAPIPKWNRHDRIRVGYFSPDFRRHPVSSLTVELFETHDRSRFEVAAFSYGPDTQDDMRKRLQSAFEHFIDVRDRSDEEVALLARRMELDVAVDLGGFTEDCRPGILARRAAPLQIGYLGYPGTLGAPYMDYLVADATIVPPTHRQYYAEKILSLYSFQPNPSARPLGEKPPTREELGLPRTGFVFCCFNTHYKITPAVFRVWMRILDRVEGSVLWLRSDNEIATGNLKREAEAYGIAAERLVFAPKLPSMQEHLARYGVADLFLDTFPYGAHTTASDALWVGLPVLTCMGDAFAGRVGASLLNAVSLPELITATLEQYERLAVELAVDVPRLTEMRRRLAGNRHSAALFDIVRYTRDLESVYDRVYERYQSGLPTEHLELQERQAGEASAHINRASAADPGEATFELDRGHALQALERWNEAAGAYRKSLHLQPNFADAQIALGIVLQRSGQLAEAATAYRRALALKPEDSRVWGNLGTVLRELGDIDESIRSLKSAMALDPGIVSYAVNLGVSLCRKRDFTAAEALLRDTLNRDPQRADAAFHLGNALQGQGLARDALEYFRRAVALRSSYAEAWNALADSYKALGDFSSARAAYESAIGARPDFVPASGNLGVLLCLLRQNDEAEEVLRRGLESAPHNSSLHSNLGTVLKDMGRLDEAIECYRKAIETDPSNSTAHSNLAYSLTFQSSDPEPLLAVCSYWKARVAEQVPTPFAHQPKHWRRRKLRIGYVSPDFRDHCQSLFTLPLFERHDHDEFEIFCYSTVEQPDDVTGRIAAQADGWREARLLDDAALAKLIREDGIDILMDLTMHMANGRPLMFARKPAPIQIAWLAYPGTTGIDAMDYRFSDPRLDPEGFDHHYSERTVRLPDTFWCYDPMAGQPINALPALERGYPTFGCLNNPCKVTDTTLQLWGRVMRALPNARLSLLSPGGQSALRLLGRLEAHGIASSRIQLVEFQPRAQYLRAYLDIDLALDTFPYNGHTTSLDALWMGVPVVTRVGRTCVGRGGLSQLFHVDLLDLAAESDAAFVDAAVALANDLPRLAALRQTLRPRLERSALMDGQRFARNMEEAYRRVWGKYCGESAAAT